MPLLPEDEAYLTERSIPFDVVEDGGMTCVLLPDWDLPPSLSAERTTVLIRLAPGYPDVPPDMWWVDPPVHRADGKDIPATQSVEQYVGRTWQRWSRHFNGGQWKPGVDRLSGFLRLIDAEFLRAGEAAT